MPRYCMVVMCPETEKNIYLWNNMWEILNNFISSAIHKHFHMKHTIILGLKLKGQMFSNSTLSIKSFC